MILLRILPLLIVLLILPLWGIDKMLLAKRVKRKWRFLLYAPNVFLLLSAASLGFLLDFSDSTVRLMALLLTLILCIGIPQAITALLLLPSIFISRHSLRITSAWKFLASICGLLSFGLLVFGFTLGYRQVQVERLTYESKRLPQAFDGFRIVQISDLHLGTLRGKPKVVQTIVDSVNACHPDLIVFTGDLVNYISDEVSEFEEILKGLKAKNGIISVMGNHDYAQYYRHASSADSLADIRKLQEKERALGWNLLLNANHVVRRGNDSIALVGVENNGKPPFPALADLDQAQHQLSPSCFKVLLSHDPSHWRAHVLPETNIDLTLSGHTHGMQFRIGDFSPASWFYPEWGGIYREADGRALHVSLGAGQVMLPFRLGAWPEVNLIVLKHQR